MHDSIYTSTEDVNINYASNQSSNQSSDWLRLPIQIILNETVQTYELIGKDIPDEEYEESYIDIRRSSISAVRPFYEHNILKGVVIYVEDKEFIINILPDDFQRILNYKFEKYEKTFVRPS